MSAADSASAHTDGAGRLDPDELAAMVGHVEGNRRWTRKFQQDVRDYVAALPSDFLLGAGSHAPGVDESQGVHGATSPAGPPPSGALKERQLRILRLAADGLTNRAIAERLDLTLSTVVSDLQRSVRVLNVGHVSEAVAWVRAEDALSPERERSAD